MKKQILFGYGKNGKAVAKELDKKDFDIIVFDEKEKQEALNDGYLDVDLIKSYILDEDLLEIGIKEAEVAICVLEDEARNLFLSLSIRNLNNKIKIIAKSEDKDYYHRYKLAGVNKIISPYDIVAIRIDTILKKPVTIDIIHSIVFEDTNLYFSQINIVENSFLDGKYLSEIELEEEYNLVLVGIIDIEKSNRLQFIGDYDHKLDAGDVLVVIGPEEEIERIKNEMEVYTKWHSQ
jgi:voltage-gated potassium channel